VVTIKSKKEIEYMREACRATALVHKRVEEAIKPGVTTAYLKLQKKLLKNLEEFQLKKDIQVE
jgi:Xaa-Pro aminopeptidase